MEFYPLGVHGVSIDEVNKMVSVRGKADPWVLIKAIEENGNFAELLSYEKEPNRKNYSESSSTVSEIENVQKNGREKKKSYSFWRGGYKDNKNNFFKSKKEKKGNGREEEEHKIEDYVPLKIDPEVCRDPFCKVHKRRPVITSRVPSRDNENHPHHTGIGGVFPGAHQLFHHTNPYGFQYRDKNGPEILAPPYSSFYSRRPAAPYGFTFHGNRNPGNCTTM